LTELNKVKAEHNVLTKELKELLESKQLLTYRHYKELLEATEFSKELLETLLSVSSNLQTFIENLPCLTKRSETFYEHSMSFLNNLKDDLFCLFKSYKIYEILELPDRMEACVRNGRYEDALEIKSLTEPIEKQFCHVKLIKEVVQKVKKAEMVMLQQLFETLRGSLSLNESVEVIQLLRRTDQLTEDDLKVKFLQCRGFWFRKTLGEVDSGDPYIFISEIFEVTKTLFFDTVTQYSTNFLESKNYLSLWTSTEVCTIISLVRKQLSRIKEASALRMLLCKVLDVNAVLRLVGTELSCLVVPVIHEALLTLFHSSIAKGHHIIYYLFIICTGLHF
jgi:hypothetical protein